MPEPVKKKFSEEFWAVLPLAGRGIDEPYLFGIKEHAEQNLALRFLPSHFKVIRVRVTEVKEP